MTEETKTFYINLAYRLSGPTKYTVLEVLQYMQKLRNKGLNNEAVEAGTIRRIAKQSERGELFL